MGKIIEFYYVVMIVILIVVIILIKGYTFSSIGIVYPYTILVTTFMLSRIIGSFFYKSPVQKIDYDYTPSVTFIIPCKNELHSP